jgi:glycosyltransferase involved in cell wall biosynthesis
MQPVHAVLEQLAVNNKVISVQQINYNGEITKHGVEYKFVTMYKKKVLLPFRLNLLVKNFNADVVIVHGTVFPLQTILLRLLIGINVSIIIQHHAELPFKGIKKVVQKMASLFVNAYFFPAKATGIIWQDKGNIIPTKPIFNIHEGTSIMQQIGTNTSLTNRINGYPTYVWVGRLDANKHPLLTIKAFMKFLHIQPSAILYMIFYRNDTLEEIKNYLKQEDSKNKIILVGKVARHNMLNWYNNANFYISSSFKEGTSFTLSEAMSCGCVPIVTSLPSHVDMLGNNCGLLYQAGNEAELYNALIASTKLCIKTESLKTQQQYKQHLSPFAIANNIEFAIASLK